MIALVFCAVACASPPPAKPAGGQVPTVVTAAAGDGDLRIAELGKCALDSGETIEECRIGYRTYGKLDATKSNVVLWPTWFTGTTKHLAFVPKDFVDTKRFFLVLVDAIGNGVSSAPSSSRVQPRLRFPKFTVHDMVESQRRLLREVLKVEKLHTVMGISMGGMQSFEWAVSHPDEVGRIVPIVGTPQLTAQDLLLWHAELDLLDGSKAYAGGEYQDRPKIPALHELHWLMLSTAQHRNQETSRAQFAAFKSEIENDTEFDWNDWHRQLEAMIVHDVARSDGGDLEKAAKRVKAKALVVVAEHDRMVSPEPAKAFAKATNAKLVITESPWGHMAPGHDPAVPAAVKAFLAE
ncbi:MAG: alpha/beta fold hydrolase [Labilithrix sp.]|nr:alpha/beta fold hydrolase [Labilithrix sp.]MCW5813464.1 alpha/beta fold hydrolase [Labilithrix sp.]